jgi:hypothetical protein
MQSLVILIGTLPLRVIVFVSISPVIAIIGCGMAGNPV